MLKQVQHDEDGDSVSSLVLKPELGNEGIELFNFVKLKEHIFMDEIVKNNLQFDPNEFKKIYLFHIKRLYPFKSRVFLFWFIILLFMGSLLGFLSYISNDNGNFYFGLFMILYSLYCLYKHFRLASKKIKINEKYHRDTSTREVYRMNSDGYTVNSGTHNSEYKWGHFVELLLLPNSIVVYHDKFNFAPFYKKNYTDQEFETLKSWISAKVKKISKMK